MITTPFDLDISHHATPPFPLDRLIIKTSVPILDEIAECRPEAVASLEPKFGKLVSSIKHDALKRRSDTPIPTRYITLYPDGAVRLKVQMDDEWLIREIDFNVGRLLHGHNGRILDTDSVHMAFSILLDVIRPLLADADDLKHVLPGLDKMSLAYWHSMEIAFQQFDPDGNLLRALENSKHESINTPSKFSRLYQTTTFENSRKSLKIICYRKDLELRDHKHLRPHLPDDCPVARFEVRLSGDMLAKHVKGGTWNSDRSRLTAFGPTDIREAFKSVLDKLTGVLCGEPAERADNLGYARIIPMMQAHGLCTGVTFAQFLAIYVARFLGENTAESISNSKSAMRKAWHNEVAATMTSDVRSIFTDVAWHDQAHVPIKEIEDLTLAHFKIWQPHEHVVRAYSDRCHDHRIGRN